MADEILTLLTSAYGTLPLILGLIALVCLVAVGWMFKMRLFVFKWWGSVWVPCVLVHEGNRIVPYTDRLKMSKEGNQLFFESKRFGDVFNGTHLQDRLVFGGKNPTMLPVFRANKEWRSADVERDPTGKPLYLKPMFDSDQRLALATMRKNNTDYLADPSFWAQNGPLIALAVVAIVFLGSILVITQYTSSVLNNAHAQTSASNDRLANATWTLAEVMAGNCSALTPRTTPVPPRG